MIYVFGFELIHLVLMLFTQVVGIISLTILSITLSKMSESTRKSFGFNPFFLGLILVNLINLWHIISEFTTVQANPETKLSQVQHVLNLAYHSMFAASVLLFTWGAVQMKKNIDEIMAL